MTRFKVECGIKYPTHYHPHERIMGLGGQNPTWYDQEANIILCIERETDSYFTIVKGKEAEIVIATHRGRKYLKCIADSYTRNILLNHPDCK